MANNIEKLSSWWGRSVILIIVLCFSVLIWVAISAYDNAPPIPERVVGTDGNTLFTANDILTGQEIFLKHGLMENGSIWGHGAYLGPDFSADYLHRLALHTAEVLARRYFGAGFGDLDEGQSAMVMAEVGNTLKQNRYDPRSRALLFTDAESYSYINQQKDWKDYFAQPQRNRGLLPGILQDREELRQLTAFFAWTAWASVANRPNKAYSYTNNFPYEPLANNRPTVDAYLWSALRLITLLAGIALVLFAFGKFAYLGWKGTGEHVHPGMLPGITTGSQRATIKFFLVAALLFLAQVLVGGATATSALIPQLSTALIWRPYFPAIYSAPGICSLPFSG